jgi:separase
VCAQVRTALQAYHARRPAPDPLGPGERPVVLILDRHVQALPWESMPLLRGRAVSRLPSLSLLRDCLLRHPPCGGGGSVSVDATRAFYVLNPGGDLPQTQADMEPLLSRPPGWSGVSGRLPSEAECESALTTASLFLYFGHGGGENLIRGQRIQRLPRCAPTFLMGCSSGALRGNGHFDVSGTALHYLLGGCPSLVANLWEVTDKDIDLFSVEMLEHLGVASATPAAPAPSIPLTVSRARDSCKLRFLNGAAPIVYGIPLHLSWGGEGGDG